MCDGQRRCGDALDYKEVLGLKYTMFTGDCDSKSYTAVLDLKPHGHEEPDQITAKEECTETAWHSSSKLKKDLKGTKLDDGKPIGEKGCLADPVSVAWVLVTTTWQKKKKL